MNRLARVWRILAGSLLFLLSLELSLWVGGVFYFWLQTRGQPAVFTIMALGESTTQGGLGLHSYPGQLELSLQKTCRISVRVVNLGVAGVNSRDILAKLPARLREYRPDLVTTMIGVNDMPNMAGENHENSGSFLRRKISNTHVMKFFRYLRDFARSQWSGHREEDSAIQLSDDPEQILIKIRRGQRFDTWDFGPRFTQELVNQRGPEAAVTMLEEVLRVFPDHNWALFGIGFIYRSGRIEDQSRAEEFLSRAVVAAGRERPWSAFFRIQLASYFWQRGKVREFRRVLAEVKQGFPMNGQEYIRLVELYLRASDRKSAREILFRALAENPENVGLRGMLREVFQLPLAEGRPVSDAVVLPELRANYRAIVREIVAQGAMVVALPYALQPDEPLRRLLEGVSSEQGKVDFFSNEALIRAAVKAHGYDAIFRDRFGGDFGHFNQ